MGNTKEIAFNSGQCMVGSRKASQAGRAKLAFARLFAATVALTGAAMTVKTVTRTAAAQDGGTARATCPNGLHARAVLGAEHGSGRT